MIPVKVLIYKNGVAISPTATVIMRVVGSNSSGGALIDDVEEYTDADASNQNTNLFRWSAPQWIYDLEQGPRHDHLRRLTDGGKETNNLGDWTADGRRLTMGSNRANPSAIDAYLVASFKRSAVVGDRPEKVLICAAQARANSSSWIVELTSFAPAGNAMMPVVCSA